MSKQKSRSSQDIKADLKRLKKAGLYSGDLRRSEPTRYAKDLTKKFADVLKGKAQVVSVPKVPSGRSKGSKTANEKAKALAAEFGGTIRAKQNKLIIKTSNKAEKAVYLPSTNQVVTRYKRTDNKTITHQYVKVKNGQLPPLGLNESYSLPFNRGRNGVEYVMRATPEEILAIANEYEHRGVNPYRGATGNIQIAFEGKKRRKPPKTKLFDVTDNVVDLNSRRKK